MNQLLPWIAGEEAHVRILLEQGAVVRGVVRESGSGPPIGEALVYCQPVERSEVSSVILAAPSVVTGVDGGFVFSGLDPGDHRVFASHPDYFQEKETYRVKIGDEEPAALELMMIRGGKLAGRILDVTDPSALGVELKSSGDAGRRRFSSRVEFDGRYLITGIPPGSYEVRLSTPEREAGEGGLPVYKDRVVSLATVEVLAGETAEIDAKVE